MKYERRPDQRDTGVTGEGKARQSNTIPHDIEARVGQAAIEDAIMRQNNRFYQERVLTYGSWENFLNAHIPANKSRTK